MWKLLSLRVQLPFRWQDEKKNFNSRLEHKKVWTNFKLSAAVTPLNQQNVFNCLLLDSCIKSCQLCKNNLIAFRLSLFNEFIVHWRAHKGSRIQLLQCKLGVYIQLWSRALLVVSKQQEKKKRIKKKRCFAKKRLQKLCVCLRIRRVRGSCLTHWKILSF